jgi:YVTN family beta-propeller protein
MPMIFSARITSAITLCGAFIFAPHVVSATTSTLTLFETGQVRPLALSHDGKYLYAVNTPDAKLEIFSVNSEGIEARGSVSVGLEPVAVAVRNENEVWVVNHLSDSVSVVDVHESEHPRVTRTLLVGDEPRDLLFAGKK